MYKVILTISQIESYTYISVLQSKIFPWMDGCDNINLFNNQGTAASRFKVLINHLGFKQ